jgi:hypothetical protein
LAYNELSASSSCRIPVLSHFWAHSNTLGRYSDATRVGKYRIMAYSGANRSGWISERYRMLYSACFILEQSHCQRAQKS